MQFYVTWTTILLLPLTAQGSIQTDLTDNIFNRYDSGVKPYCEGKSPKINVTIDVALRQIVELDEPMQVIKLNIWVRMRWIDCRLTWNKTDYGNIDKLIVPKSRIWIPDITLYDSVNKEESDKEFLSEISSDGVIGYNFPLLTESRCKVNVRYFPFDHQSCKLIFGSWAHNGNEIDVLAKSDNGDLSSMDENVEWEVLQFATKRHQLYYKCCPEPYPDITFFLNLRRKPEYYVIHILLPCILISAIGILGFVLPAESGEKVSVGITVLLSQAVFLLLVGDKLPPSSETLPLIAMYFDYSMFLVCVACVISVVVLNLYYRTDSKMPRWVKVLFLNHCKGTWRCGQAEHMQCETNPKYDFERTDPPRISSFADSPELKIKSRFHHTDTVQVKTDKRQYCINNNDGVKTRDLTLKMEEKSNETEWQQLANTLDRIGLVFYVTGFTIGTVVFLSLFRNQY